jgi:hypothetical protein
MSSWTIHHSDALPSATARKGSIRLALRATDIDGVERVVCEIAISPNTASYVIVELSGALAEHNGAKACNVYAFGAKTRRAPRKQPGVNPEPA